MTKKVEKWFQDRNLQDAEPIAQYMKLVEEVAELGVALQKKDKPEVIDALGDIQVVLIGLGMQLDLSLYDCLEVAYDEIKDRKGRLVNGLWVKEKDL